MIFRIPEGKHYSRPFRFWMWWRRPVFSWLITFDETCRYYLDSDDQYDTNKLIGVGYLPGHHKDSARFGWRYWADSGLIELKAYCYVEGRRTICHICTIEIGKQYRLQLNITSAAYVFDVLDLEEGKPSGVCAIPHLHAKKLQYRLGTYFGGNVAAPHDIKIQIEKS